MSESKNRVQASQLIVNQWFKSTEQIKIKLEKVTDPQFHSEWHSESNKVSWIFGHLFHAATNMMEILGIHHSFPNLKTEYGNGTDGKAGSLGKNELFELWSKMDDILHTQFHLMNQDDWLSKHNNVSAEDFELDPTRNKLNVLLTRLNHQYMHLGQLAFII